MNTCRQCGQPCPGQFCSDAHRMDWWRRTMGPILLVAVLCVSVAAVASDDWQAKCDAEGGCLLITHRAYDHLVGEIDRLQRAILAMRKEQCA